MRRSLAVATTVAALVSLSGCFKLDMDMTVNSDDTLDGVVIFALNEDLADMAEEGSELTADDLPEGATIEEYDEDGFVGQKVILDDVAMSDLNETFSSEGDTGGPGEWSLTHEGDEYRFTGDMDLTDMAADEDSDVDMSAFMSGAELRVAFTFPGDVTESNGEIDGSTVVWEPEVGEANEMTAVAEESSGLSTLLIALVVGGAVLVLALIGLALWLRGRGKRPAAAEVEPAPVAPTQGSGL
jgi:hypothetical protein